MAFGPATKERLDELRVLGARKRNLRTEVLRSVKDGRITILQAIEEHPDLIAETRVGRVIKSVPGWGPHRVHLLLSELRVEPERTMRGLGPRQRERLLAAISA